MAVQRTQVQSFEKVQQGEQGKAKKILEFWGWWAWRYRGERRIVAKTDNGSVNNESTRSMDAEAQTHSLCMDSWRSLGIKKRATHGMGE